MVSKKEGKEVFVLETPCLAIPTLRYVKVFDVVAFFFQT